MKHRRCSSFPTNDLPITRGVWFSFIFYSFLNRTPPNLPILPFVRSFLFSIRSRCRWRLLSNPTLLTCEPPSGHLFLVHTTFPFQSLLLRSSFFFYLPEQQTTTAPTQIALSPFELRNDKMTPLLKLLFKISHFSQTLVYLKQNSPHGDFLTTSTQSPIIDSIFSKQPLLWVFFLPK